MIQAGAINAFRSSVNRSHNDNRRRNNRQRASFRREKRNCNAFVTLQSFDGAQARTVRTNSLGYYQFSDVTVGNTYLISVSAKAIPLRPIRKSLHCSTSWQTLILPRRNETRIKPKLTKQAGFRSACFALCRKFQYKNISVAICISRNFLCRLKAE